MNVTRIYYYKEDYFKLKNMLRFTGDIEDTKQHGSYQKGGNKV